LKEKRLPLIRKAKLTKKPNFPAQQKAKNNLLPLFASLQLKKVICLPNFRVKFTRVLEKIAPQLKFERFTLLDPFRNIYF